jgi:hypothetical protein
VIGYQRISVENAGFAFFLDDRDEFGISTGSVGDLDGDGVPELAVGVYGDDDGSIDGGAVWILYLNADGSFKMQQKVSATAGGFDGPLVSTNRFGLSVADVGDLDDDGVDDLAVGAFCNAYLSTDAGAVWILRLHRDGSVKAQQRIGPGEGGFTGVLDPRDWFGRSVAALGDFDLDGIEDVAVGAPQDDDGATDAGAVWLLFLDRDGTVRAHRKISAVEGGFGGILSTNDRFGCSIAALGDFDGDGVPDLAVGARNDDDGGSDKGALWILHLNADGSVRAHRKISAAAGGFGGSLGYGDQLGYSLAAPGDLDGDGVIDLLAGAPRDDQRGTDRGALWALFLNADATVRDQLKITGGVSGLADTLRDHDFFGASLATLGDIDGDGFPEVAAGANGDDDRGTNRGAVRILSLDVGGLAGPAQKISDDDRLGNDRDDFGHALARLQDLDGNGVGDVAVGAPGDDGAGSNRGAIWIAFLRGDGSVDSTRRINDAWGGFGGGLDGGDEFGRSVTSVGDLDGDGVEELAVGAPGDDDGGADRGAIWLLFLNRDGTVRDRRKISGTTGGFDGVLADGDRFGESSSPLGDFDGDSVEDVAVGAPHDGDGGFSAGAVWVLFLNADGSVKAHRKIGATQGGLSGPLDADDRFGSSLTALGDLDGDGVTDLAVGAPGTSAAEGAAWILFLNGDATVRSHQRIASGEAGFSGVLVADDQFGWSMASFVDAGGGAAGDLDGDAIGDLAVGAQEQSDDTGSPRSRGAVWVLFLNADGTVKSHGRIGNDEGGFGPIDPFEGFGRSLCSPGDFNGDGFLDLVAGAPGDDNLDGTHGAIWMLYLDGPLTPVDLLYFDARRAGRTAVLRWRVSSARDHAGFDVFRETGFGPRERITSERLDGLTTYEFIDRDPPSSETRYWLAEHDGNGDVTWHGPAVVAALGIESLARPLFIEPNPTGGRARFRFVLGEPADVRLRIFDVVGRPVATVADARLPAGAHAATWLGSDGRGDRVPVGVYFARLETGRTTSIVKVVVAR